MGTVARFLSILVCAAVVPWAGTPAWATSNELIKIPKLETPEVWQVQFCRQHPGAACEAAQALHWFRTEDIYFEVGFNTMKGAAFIGSAAFVARLIWGETETVQYMMTFSRAGMIAGGIMVVSGASVAVLATVISAQMISSTGDYFDDKPDILAQCQGVDLNQYKTAEGLQQLLKATPEEKQRIALCIPEDKSFFNFLKDSATSGANTRHQLAVPPT